MKLTCARLTAAFLLCVASSSTTAAMDIKPIAPGFLKAIVSAHAERPTIVHFWSLTCSVCMAELPNWGEFLKAETGFDLVLINWDTRSATVERIKARLEKASLTAPEQWMLANGFEEQLRFEADPGWFGELPYTRMIAKDGSVSTFSGTADFETLKSWIASPANN